MTRYKWIPLIVFIFIVPCFASDYGKVTSQKITDRVYLFMTAPYGAGLSGNSVAMIGDDCVLIFDSNGLPKTAETILSQVHAITSKPVRYVVNSHWHWDHWAGNQVYLAAFPDLQIIAQEKTLEQMLAVEPRWNAEGLQTQLPAYLEDLRKKLSTLKSNEKKKDQEELVDAVNNFLQQKRSLKKTYPNVTYSEAMTVNPGNERVNLAHARAITIGDTYAYLPQEKVLITGDALLSPYPYSIGGTYPQDWLKTLKQFATLQPSIIIPGHGKPQTMEFLQQNIKLFEDILQQVKDAKAKNLSMDQTIEAIGKNAKELAAEIGINDEQTTGEFKAYFLDTFVSRAYRELDAPLPDLPDGMK
jgi:cyclase